MAKQEQSWLMAFFPNVHPLSQQEIAVLPLEKKRAAEASGQQGVWLKVLCPKDACVTGGGTISLPAVGVSSKEEKGLWLKIFCYTGLP